MTNHTLELYKPKRLATVCFYIAVGALQLEEFDIMGISVFQLVMLPFAVIGILANMGRKCNQPEFSLMFSLLTWLVISCLTNGDWMGAVNKILLVPYVYFVINYIKSNQNHIIRFDWIFMWVPLLSFMSNISGNANYFGLRFSGIHSDANFACLIFVISFVSKLSFFNFVSFIWKWAYAMLMGIDLYLILLTQSRGGLIALFLVIFMYILFKSKSAKGRLLLVVGLIFLVSSLLTLANSLDYWSGDNDLFTYALARFQNDSLERGSGRGDLWTFALKYLLDNGGLFIPVGYNNYRELTNFWSHNSYIDLALDATGIITILFMLYLLYCLVSYYLRRTKTLVMRPDYDAIFYIGIAGCFSLFFLSAYMQKLFFFSLLTVLLAGHFKIMKNVRQIDLH